MNEESSTDNEIEGGKPTDRYQRVKPEAGDTGLGSDSTPLATEVSEVSDELIHKLAVDEASYPTHLEGQMQEEDGSRVGDEDAREGPRKTQRYGKMKAEDQRGAGDLDATPFGSDKTPIDPGLDDATDADGAVKADSANDSTDAEPPSASRDATTPMTRQRQAGAGAGRGADPLLGKLIGGLVLEEVIGRGGMGWIYRGRHPHLHKDFAIKILPDRLAQLPPFVERFINEGRAAARITHPNAVRVNAAGKESDIHFIVMELVKGRDLKRIVEDKGSIHEFEVLRIALEVTGALAAAHGVGIIHRDIKPENLILEDGSGRVRVTDFGLSMDTSADLAAVEASIGTPNYMSPEQCRGLGCDERSDIYALGATCYYLLTHRPPYPGHTAAAVMIQHVAEAPPDPRVYAPRTSDATAALVMRMMAKDPAKRYSSAKDLAVDIEGVRAGQMPRAPVTGGADAELTALLHDAIKHRADDLHLELASASGDLSMRIDGQLCHMRRIEHGDAVRIKEAILRATGLPIDIAGMPRSGLIEVPVFGGSRRKIFVSYLPGAVSERITLRILPASDRYPVALDQLGLDAEARDALARCVAGRQGVVVATSLAASSAAGRPSTQLLYGLIDGLRREPLAIASIEDEIELVFEGVTQIRLDAARGLDQATAFRAALDQDADALLLRDTQPALWLDAFAAAESGRLILAQGNLPDAISMLRFMLENGVSKAAITRHVRGIIASHEIPTPCSACLAPMALRIEDHDLIARALAELPGGAELLATLDRDGIKAPRGCKTCNRSRTTGVEFIHEILTPAAELIEALRGDASNATARGLAMKTARESRPVFLPLAFAAAARLRDGRIRIEDAFVLLSRLEV